MHSLLKKYHNAFPNLPKYSYYCIYSQSTKKSPIEVNIKKPVLIKIRSLTKKHTITFTNHDYIKFPLLNMIKSLPLVNNN